MLTKQVPLSKKIIAVLFVAILLCILSICSNRDGKAIDSLSKISFGYGSEQYVEDLSAFNHSSAEDMVQLADEIMNGMLYVYDQFEGMPYETTETIDWNAKFTTSPNTFQLYLQGLTPLQALARACNITGNQSYLQTAIGILNSWTAYEQDSERSGGNSMLWNDHGMAIRAESILSLMIACEGTKFDTSGFREQINKLLCTHAEALADETKYTKNHNHGIIQDCTLLHVAYFIDSDMRDVWINLAGERLKAQEAFAFSSEMVHVENSAGYTAGVIELFYNISQFLTSMNNPLGEELVLDVYNAAEFLAWIHMPNGLLAPIGDSMGSTELQVSTLKYAKYGNPRLNFASLLGSENHMTAEQAAETVKYYPASGYFFYRENWIPEHASDTTWKLFKAGYSSNTHKHADDLSFILYSKGYEIFTDSGKYNYMTGSPFRDYVVSSSAHNTITVDEKTYSPTEENAGKTGMLWYGYVDSMDHVIAFNDMYPGVQMDRHFFTSGDLTVLYDNIVSDDTHTYSQLFHLAENMEIVSSSDSETLLRIADTEYYVRIRQMLPVNLAVYSGREDTVPLYGHISRTLNQVTDTDTLVYIVEGENVDYVTAITIEDGDGMVRLKDGTLVSYQDVGLDTNEYTLVVANESYVLFPRIRFAPELSKLEITGTQLYAEAAPSENCVYTWYLTEVESGEVFYKGEYSEDTKLDFDLTGHEADIFVKLYVRSTNYNQRKSEMVAALVYDQDTQSYILDQGEKYPYLNLVYRGHSVEKLSEYTYVFQIDYEYSWNTTQRWYVYQNGTYLTVLATQNQHKLEYTFIEPGDYTIMYYLRTANGDNEFWNFESITVLGI